MLSYASELGGQCVCDDVTAGWFGHYNGQDSIPEQTGGAVFDINQVLTGALSLTSSIDSAVSKVFCQPYPEG
jgi:hypothetical protein